MTVEEKKVVSFHYTLKNAEGEEIETSRDGEPMAYLHGAKNIIVGLESAMEGRDAGDSFTVTVPPEAAYGERVDNIQRISSKHLGKKKVKPGDILSLSTRQGPVQVTVVKVGRFNVDVDANHPLAGQTLTFDVEITGVRDATPEELDHGHAHGPDGHAGHDH